jgi:hypothetical protein
MSLRAQVAGGQGSLDPEVGKVGDARPPSADEAGRIDTDIQREREHV